MFKTEEGKEAEIKNYYDGLIGLTPYLDVTGGFYKRLESVYNEQGYPILSVSPPQTTNCSLFTNSLFERGVHMPHSIISSEFINPIIPNYT